MDSYSGYLDLLANDYIDRTDVDVMALRRKMMEILLEESKLNDIVSLVGADVLPEEQRLVLDIARILRVGYLQQNSFHEIDTYVPLQKQVRMLQVIDTLYENGKDLLALHAPLSVVHDEELFQQVTMMKYNVPNDDLSAIDALEESIVSHYDALKLQYQGEDAS